MQSVTVILYYTNPLTQWHINLIYLYSDVLREASFTLESTMFRGGIWRCFYLRYGEGLTAECCAAPTYPPGSDCV